jgi:Raf kinase inhibitor-like YbhB/YbcL family protein
MVFSVFTIKNFMRLLTTLSILGAVAAITSFSNSPKLKITSTSFANNGSIPSKYSCEGEEASPPLLISDIPSGTKSLAIILHDPDAPREGGFTHWVVWNVEPGNNNIPENFKGAQQGLNGAGQPGYKGMCPPSGTHHYHFMVYALDTKLDIDKKTDKAGLEKSMQGHILAQGDLVGLYKKTKE